ncbi:MAG: sigma-70 family RNA polymerase sigma factor [Raineya sp.]|jgi:RNA polymerase sigma-70 factor (ECF subfamily)|nr:sigma-70 family RNA polymerase sigma factor [Raineya sp.]
MDIEDNKEFSQKALYDFKLVELAKNGDQNAFAELMKRYNRSLYHTILKMIRNVDDAEDLTIEAFAKAFKNLDKFKEDYTFSTWLFRIATNNCIDFIRKKKMNTLSINNMFTGDGGEEVGLDIPDESNPQEEAIRSQKIALMQNLVSKLPTKYRKLVTMRYFDEMAYQEIAEELELPIGTVKAQLHRARELLYDMIKNQKDHI